MTEGHDRRFALGIALGAVAATGLAFITTFARIAYDDGTNPWTVILLRAGFGVLAGLALTAMFRRPLALPSAARLPTLAAGLGLTMISLGYLSSVAFIPVGLAALLFYTFPLMVLAYTTVAARRRPGPRQLLTFGAAFVGLALALGPEIGVIDWRGVVLALVAAVGSALLFVAGERATAHTDMISVTFFANLTVVPIVAVAVLALGAYRAPTEPFGWWAIAAAGLCYMVGLLATFPALKFAGATPSALVFNTEPLISIVVAAVLLGEALSPVQYLGGAIVIAALMGGTWLRRSAVQPPNRS